MFQINSFQARRWALAGWVARDVAFIHQRVSIFNIIIVGIEQNEPFLARRWVRPFAFSTRASRGSGGSFAVAKSLSVLEAVVCRGGCACGCY